MTDPIADMIIRIKNGYLARKNQVEIPFSKLNGALAKILVREGYLSETETLDTQPQKTLKVTLKYIGKQPAVTDVKRLSKPGRRAYAPANNLPRVLGGYGICILSTNKGILTDKEARKQNVGGEVLCSIW